MGIELIVQDRFPDSRTSEYVLQYAGAYMAKVLGVFYQMNHTRFYKIPIVETSKWTPLNIWDEPIDSRNNRTHKDEFGNNLRLSYRLPEEFAKDFLLLQSQQRLDSFRASAHLYGVTVKGKCSDGRTHFVLDIFDTTTFRAYVDGQPAPFSNHALRITSLRNEQDSNLFEDWLKHKDKILGQVKVLDMTGDRHCKGCSLHSG